MGERNPSGLQEAIEGLTALAQLARWASLWRLPGLEHRVSISFSPRMRRCLGRCMPQQGIIRLNPRLVRDPPMLLEVVCHELAHAAVFELYGRKVRPHGVEWAALMRAAGFEPRVRVHWPFAGQGARFEHRCPVCQASRIGGRRVRQWRCVTCLRAGRGGRLEITRLAAPEV